MPSSPRVRQSIYRERRRFYIKCSEFYREQLKHEVFSRYSEKEPSCACCGERVYSMLSLDHINGWGNEHRKTTSCAYDWAIQNHFPEKLRILCNNCNCSLGLYGYCPHNSTESLLKKLNNSENELEKTPSLAEFACGTKVAQSKLTESKVKQIRSFFLNGCSKKSIARRFSVSNTTIRNVVTGRTWNHV